MYIFEIFNNSHESKTKKEERSDY